MVRRSDEPERASAVGANQNVIGLHDDLLLPKSEAERCRSFWSMARPAGDEKSHHADGEGLIFGDVAMIGHAVFRESVAYPLAQLRVVRDRCLAGNSGFVN